MKRNKSFIVTILLALFFSLNLQADFVDRLIQDADTLYKKNTPYNLKRSYQLYKKAYGNAKKKRSKYQTYQSLYGIIKVGKKLKYDVKSYQNRFKILSLPKYKNHTVTDEKLVIRFDQNIDKSFYRYFRLSDKRLVVDIYSDFPHKTKRVRDKFIKKITMANYQQALMRVVLETKHKKLFNINTWKNSIIFDLKSKKQKAKKQKTKTIEPIQKSDSLINMADRKVIVIDPGHGGRDSGAVGYRGLKEKTVTLAVSKYLQKELKNRGYKVYMTREKDKYIKLTKRTKLANKKSAHLFISIHANSMPSNKRSINGIETYFLSKARTARAKRVAAKENEVDLKAMESMSKKTFLNFLNREKIVSSNKLAIDLQKGALDSLRSKYSEVRDAGVKEGPFWVLVGAQMPAVLVEVGFISNKKEAKRLGNSHYQRFMAKGLADGIDRFFINNEKI